MEKPIYGRLAKRHPKNHLKRIQKSPTKKAPKRNPQSSRLEELQEKRHRLVDAETALEKASGDAFRLGLALKEAGEVGLPEWNKETGAAGVFLFFF